MITVDKIINKGDMIMNANYKIYQGDCLEVMNKLPDKSIDLLITDPPYLHVKGGSKCKRINRGVYDEKKEIKSKMSDFDEFQIFSFLNIVKMKMKKMNAFVFCSKLQITFYLKWISQYKKYQYDILIWDKCRSGLIGHKAFATNIEYIIRIYEYGCGLREVKNEDKLISEYYQKIQSIPSVKNKKHPAEKPIELIKRFILLSSNENDIVFDPFMGSGTTGVSCMNLNRNFIGIELDENYFNIAKNRIEEVYKNN